MEQIKSLNVAIVGGGPGCKAIIDMIFAEKLSQLQINLIGIACTNPEAVGYRYAQEKGIYTTEDYRDLYKLQDLNMIIELTGRDEVANEISRTKPEYVRLMDHVAANLLWDLFRAEAIAALKEAEEKYKTVVEGSLTGIFIHQDGKYVFVNNRFAEIHGYTTEELLGKEFLTLIHPDEREALANVASRRIDGEAVPERYEVRRLGRDGKTIWCEMMATRIEYGGRPAVMGNIIDISERKRALATVQQRDETLSGIIASMTDPMSMLDNEHNIVWTNDVAKRLFGPDLVGKKCYSVYHGYDKPCTSCVVRKCFEDGNVHEHETEVIRADGNRMVFWCTASVAGWHRDGRAKLVVEISRDITERKRAEEILRETVYQQQLAYDQAIIYGEQLNKQIRVRKRAEEALRKRKEELKAQARNLEEMNTALKVLLKHREEDKSELEEKVLANVKELVLPYVEALKNTKLGGKQVAYASIIESHLNDIISPFLRKLSSKHRGLTPKEIQVAGFIKAGKTTKEIAGLLNASVRAVEFHRENIRSKLGLKNKKANLRSYLLTLQ
jgi:PAS domain S-box-containing protein